MPILLSELLSLFQPCILLALQVAEKRLECCHLRQQMKGFLLQYDLYFLQSFFMQESQHQEDIKFYGTKGKYGFLSNFYHSPFQIGIHKYQTNQHFFQSKKFIYTPYELQVIAAENPKLAKTMGKKKKMEKPQTWGQIKEEIMLEGLRAKFTQNDQLKQQLIKTGDRLLREHTERDKYWGDGGKNLRGKNRLGILLMKVREQLIKE